MLKYIIVLALLSGLSHAGEDTTQATQATQLSDHSPAADLKGIWSLDLQGLDQNVTMVLHQSSGRVYGSARCEGDLPWNAVILGTSTEDIVDLTMTSLRGASLVSTKIMGTVVRGLISGIYLQSDDLGGSRSDLFRATMISPDTSSYSPAVAEPGKSSPESGAPSTGPVVTSAIAPVSRSDASGPVQLGNTYKNVRSLAGTVPGSLGVGFIGDGTMGAGGASMG